MSLATTESTLMHSALAVSSPALRQFDIIAFNQSTNSLSSLPHEILLHIRLFLVSALIDYSISISATSLEEYETLTREFMCSHCAFYNEYIYGPDIFLWHPCGCLSRWPENTYQSFRNRHEWLESHLSHKSSQNIWEVVREVVGEFGCEVPPRLGLYPPRSTRKVILVPKHNQSFTSLNRLKRDMGLSWEYDEPCQPPRTAPHRFKFETQQATVVYSEPQVEWVVITAFDTLVAPVTATISFITSSLTLLLTVICYYSRPAALRLF
ncbi:hypothetical protein MIND_00533300 [Mycena indigotica]|uniref:Uncharacterized protein n=1 Tax=Mycena indigotica TaxID=2126181 RepID=A0A8H6SZ98_9AGAR|nr:uncharacterized protein MIND_00533300 [Mycena indigotica]KAF7307391.1 hypothetical protein MIND_00533300 [Mycena indigotica]